MSSKVRRKIGEILIEDGCLKPSQLEEALAIQKEKGGLIGRILIDHKVIDEDSLMGALGKQFKIPYISLKSYSINPDMAAVLESSFCHENVVVAFDIDSTKIYIAVADPTNEEVIEKIKAKTERVPQVFLSRISEILNAIYFLFHESA